MHLDSQGDYTASGFFCVCGHICGQAQVNPTAGAHDFPTLGLVQGLELQEIRSAHFDLLP